MSIDSLVRKREVLQSMRPPTNVVSLKNVSGRRHVSAGLSVHTPNGKPVTSVAPGLRGELEDCAECGRSHRNFTTSTREKILEYIRAGCYTTVAARASGVTSDGLRTFVSVHPSFGDAIREAQAQSEARDLDFINSADSWQARAWKLERKAPNRWGKIDRRIVSGPDGGPVKHQVAVLVVDAENFSAAKAIAGSAVPMKSLQDGSAPLPDLDAEFEVESEEVDST